MKLDANQERLKILSICPAGANDLGSALETVLQPVLSLELVRKNLVDFNSDLDTHLRNLAKASVSALLLCLPRGGMDAAEFILGAIRKKYPDLSILVVLETVDPVELHRLFSLGAADFCLAPLRLEDLLPRIMRWSRAASTTSALARQFEQSFGLQQLIGQSPNFIEAVSKIPKLAKCDAGVFISGETGTGKEMCARAIHQLGLRVGRPFVPVNCGAIPSELMENELFGHQTGAFTGASSDAQGLIHEAERGTLFLDEIDSLPLPTQVKFLRFLQDQEYRPLGARTACRADVRIITASNGDLEGLVRAGRFRADLFYRLNILPLKLPPLRERLEDIPLLARHFLLKYARKLSTPVRELTHSAMEKLLAYSWPGNIRELENVMERAIVFTDHPVIRGEDICLSGAPATVVGISFKAVKAHAVAEFEASYVERLLIANDGNISKAARAAKKNRRAFWQLMRKHNIVAPAVSASR